MRNDLRYLLSNLQTVTILPGNMMKACSICGVSQELSAFYARTGSVDGRRQDCKACSGKRQVAYSASHPGAAAKRVAAWRLAYPEKAAASSKRWEAANPEKRAAYQAKWYRTHPEQAKLSSGMWARANPERARAATNIYRKNNLKKYSAYSLAWVKAHPVEDAIRAAKRRALKTQATPGWTNHIAVGEFYSLAAIKTKATGYPWHVDHQVPLRSKLVSGLHTHYNLQVLPGRDNCVKGNRTWPDMW